MQLLAGKPIRQQSLHTPPHSIPPQRNTTLHSRTIDKNLNPIIQPTSIGTPPNRNHTTLTHSIIRRPRRRKPPLRKTQPRIVHPLAATPASKTNVVHPQKQIPLRQTHPTRLRPKPHSQHRRRLRRKQNHLLEPTALLQLQLRPPILYMRLICTHIPAPAAIVPHHRSHAATETTQNPHFYPCHTLLIIRN